MNKQLINKYKPEFDHWLKGGKMLFKYTIMDENWLHRGNQHEWNNCHISSIYIINDEFVEFRKALAEGKTIQINNSNPETWIDIDTDKLANYNPSFLRIKPDEPKFKVGDFVKFTDISNRHPQQIIKIEDEVAYTEFNKCLLTQLTLWTPVKGEWCWFYDNPNKDKYCNLSQFGEESNGRCFKTNSGTPWNFCEPFLNSLPSYLKDK